VSSTSGGPSGAGLNLMWDRKSSLPAWIQSALVRSVAALKMISGSLLQPLPVTGRFSARRVDRVRSVNHALFKRIVFLRSHVPGRTICLRERKFETRNFAVIPRPGRFRLKGLTCSQRAAQQNGGERWN
jgi:hypothetical protein